MRVALSSALSDVHARVKMSSQISGWRCGFGFVEAGDSLMEGGKLAISGCSSSRLVAIPAMSPSLSRKLHQLWFM
jgi:hypothetical protein